MIITLEQLASCYEIYTSDSSLRSNQRFGQYVYNKLGTTPWPKLFYETDDGKAYDMLYKVYTK